MKVRKKPVEVEAIHWDGSAESATEILDWILREGGSASFVCDNEEGCREGDDKHHLSIRTLEGVMSAWPGWWIICGVKGEFYGCEPEIFDLTYETSSDAFDRVVSVLLHHQATPLNSPHCKCAWRPALSLNDTEADRGQHIGHQAKVLLGEAV